MTAAHCARCCIMLHATRHDRRPGQLLGGLPKAHPAAATDARRLWDSACGRRSAAAHPFLREATFASIHVARESSADQQCNEACVLSSGAQQAVVLLNPKPLTLNWSSVPQVLLSRLQRQSTAASDSRVLSTSSADIRARQQRRVPLEALKYVLLGWPPSSVAPLK